MFKLLAILSISACAAGLVAPSTLLIVNNSFESLLVTDNSDFTIARILPRDSTCVFMRRNQLHQLVFIQPYEQKLSPMFGPVSSEGWRIEIDNMHSRDMLSLKAAKAC